MLNKKIDITMIVWITAFVLLSVLLIISFVGIAQNNRFCQTQFPSEYGYAIFSVGDKGYSTIDKMQLGYIKCCRVIYEYHQKQYECEVFKYEKR